MGGFHKRAEAGLVLILIIVIVILLFGWLINVSQRECKSNRDCGSEAYCGSDFQCHQYPNIQKTIVQYNLFWPAVIIGIAIMLAAWILKNVGAKTEVQIQPVEQSAKPEEVQDIREPYYKSEGNIRTP